MTHDLFMQKKDHSRLFVVFLKNCFVRTNPAVGRSNDMTDCFFCYLYFSKDNACPFYFLDFFVLMQNNLIFRTVIAVCLLALNYATLTKE
jgi:hypothetical protein